MEPDRFSTKKIVRVYQRVQTIVAFEEIIPAQYEEEVDVPEGQTPGVREIPEKTESNEIVIHSYTRDLPEPLPVEVP